MSAFKGTPGPWAYDSNVSTIYREGHRYGDFRETAPGAEFEGVSTNQLWHICTLQSHHVYAVYNAFGVSPARPDVEARVRERKKANARLITAAPCLLNALDALLSRYVQLVGCGDCGNWDPETEPEVIAARKAIQRVEEPQP